MARRKTKPRWTSHAALVAIHAAQLSEHGGRPGTRDQDLVEAALARPRNKWSYASNPDFAMLAAAYAFGLARNHGFIDGNKRVAFMAAYSFLGLNGLDFDATEPDVIETMERVAAGKFTEKQLTAWFRRGIAGQ